MNAAAACSFLRDGDDFLLVAHVSPDGDTLGSSLALYQALTGLGKRAQVVCEETVPGVYAALPCADVVRQEPAAPFTHTVFIDCADAKRAGTLEALALSAPHTLVIDHHGTNAGYADVNHIVDCAATGELVFALLPLLGAPLTKDIATCLYAAIATDTGNFSYANTTPDTFRIMAELLSCGIDLPELNRALFRTSRVQRMRLLGRVLSRMELFHDGAFNLSYLTWQELLDSDATSADCEGLIDSLRDIDTVEVACFLRESMNGQIRVSMRSKHSFDVSAIAQRYGGGGHRRAAGCTLDGGMAEAVAALKSQILARLEAE